MKTIKRFAWFFVHSWSYLKGQRVQMLLGLPQAWRSFNAAAKKDEDTNAQAE
jgi:hypothetical protein